MALSIVTFIVCHGGPADHFAALAKDQPNVRIYAAGVALEKLQKQGCPGVLPFSLEPDALTGQITDICRSSSVVITDVGHPYDENIQNELKKHEVTRLAYYDNFEPFVPGGYSETASKVMKAASGVLFANNLLATEVIFDGEKKPIELPTRKGIGYYPIEQSVKITEGRSLHHLAMKEAFLKEHPGDSVWVYFGGNNETYFKDAFPAFLNQIQTTLDTGKWKEKVIVLQQHPGAKKDNWDGLAVEKWIEANGAHPLSPRIVISNITTDQAQLLADGALYYQTTMAPIWSLAGLKVIQVAHETYSDILVRNKIVPSCISGESLLAAMAAPQPEADIKEAIYNGLGYDAKWRENFIEVCKK